MGTETKKASHNGDTMKAIVRLPETNENGVQTTNFLRGKTLIGQMFSAYHPTIRFEVYDVPTTSSKRVNSADEAEEWLLSND